MSLIVVVNRCLIVRLGIVLLIAACGQKSGAAKQHCPPVCSSYHFENPLSVKQAIGCLAEPCCCYLKYSHYEVTDERRTGLGSMLAIAIGEARSGLAEGGLPIGAAMFNHQGQLLSSGHNRRVQQGDPSVHAETDAFRRAGRLRSYRDVVMVTTLAPCWYCSGLVRQFGIRTL